MRYPRAPIRASLACPGRTRATRQDRVLHTAWPCGQVHAETPELERRCRPCAFPIATPQNFRIPGAMLLPPEGPATVRSAANCRAPEPLARTQQSHTPGRAPGEIGRAHV